jgi:hypothetical protein
MPVRHYGYNQVVSRNSVGTKGKIQMISTTWKHLSFALDVYILFTTIKNVLCSRNIYREDNAFSNPIAEKAEVFISRNGCSFYIYG